MADKNQTIIIKKIKKGGHGHHGGAWKVAYADFVTAMMAFFLLLWLLTATPAEQLEGLSDYFSPTLGVQGKMGIGFSGGKSPNTEGWSAGDWASLGLIFGAPPSGPIIKLPDSKNNKADDNDPSSFEKVKDNVEKAVQGDQGLSKFRDSIHVETTIDGININITDKIGRPMFEGGSDKLEPHTKRILAKIANIVGSVPNYIQVVGHTRSGFKTDNKDYTAWELSTDRANAARRFLIEAGVSENQIARVVGKADNDPIDPENRDSDENSRVAVTLLRNSMIAYHKQAAPEDVILGPLEDGLKSYVKVKRKDPKNGEGGARDADGNKIEVDKGH